MKPLQLIAFLCVAFHGLSLGISAGLDAVTKFKRRPGLFARFTFVYYVLVPSLALAIAAGFAPLASTALAFILMSLMPPGIGASEQSEKHLGNPSLSVIWQILAAALSIVMIPVFLRISARVLDLEPAHSGLSAGDVALPILLIYLTPIFFGMLWKKFFQKSASRLVKTFNYLTWGTQLILLIAVTVLAVPHLLQLSFATLASVFSFVLISLVLGHILAGHRQDERSILVSSLSFRWPAPAIMITAHLPILRPLLPVMLAYLFAGILLFSIYALRVRPSRQTGSTAQARKAA